MASSLGPRAAATRSYKAPAHELTIRVSRGTGTGRTPLAAFDQALHTAGVGDLNLVRLSSVIPPGAVVEQIPASKQIQGVHGDLLYCVYAEALTETPGKTAWAGLAWARRQDATMAGLLVEQTAFSREELNRKLTDTLQGLIDTRLEGYVPEGRALTSATCIDAPVCALVVATFAIRPWVADGAP